MDERVLLLFVWPDNPHPVVSLTPDRNLGVSCLTTAVVDISFDTTFLEMVWIVKHQDDHITYRCVGACKGMMLMKKCRFLWH